MEMPPPAPLAVTIGIPAIQISSMSRLMVRRETSNLVRKVGRSCTFFSFGEEWKDANKAVYFHVCNLVCKWNIIYHIP